MRHVRNVFAGGTLNPRHTLMMNCKSCGKQTYRLYAGTPMVGDCCYKAKAVSKRMLHTTRNNKHTGKPMSEAWIREKKCGYAKPDGSVGKDYSRLKEMH